MTEPARTGRPQAARPSTTSRAEAGVSRGTVSRVLNGGHYVSPAAQEAVNAAIRKTGYVVNRHARSLVTGRSDSVGVPADRAAGAALRGPQLQRPAARLHPGARRARHHAGADARRHRGRRRRITRYITAGHVDGVLLVSSHRGDPLPSELRERGVPVVACGKPIGLGAKVSLRRRRRPRRRPADGAATWSRWAAAASA